MAGSELVTPRTSRFHRLGIFCYRRRWWVIAAWAVLVAALIPQLQVMNDRLSNGGFEVPGSQSDDVRQLFESRFTGQFNVTSLVVLTSDVADAESPKFRAVVDAVRRDVMGAPGVAAVSDPYGAPQQSISADGHTMWIQIGLSDDQDQALEHAPEVDAAVHNAASGSDIDALVTGAPSFYRAFQDVTQHDLERAERIAFPITLLILVLAFGSLVAAGAPLLMAIVALACAFGAISIFADSTSVSIFTQNIATMIGLGVGIDYALFILTRFRERLRAGSDVPNAIGETMATSGKAVFVSALTVVVALSGTLLVNLAAFRTMGIGAMIAVAFAGAAALTFLPALVAVLGPRVNSVRVLRRKRQRETGMWHRWSIAVMHRPWLALGASVAVIVLLALPALDLRLGSSGVSILPESSEPRLASDITADAFGEGQVGPLQVIVDAPDGVLGEGFADVYAVATALAQDPEVQRVDSIATLVPDVPLEQALAVASSPEAAPVVTSLVSDDRTMTILSVVTHNGAQSIAVGDAVKRLRDSLPTVVSGDARVLVGGQPGQNEDINIELESKLPWVVGLVLVLSYFVLLLFLRSVLLPLKAILMNLGSVLASYGLVVLVFQKGFGDSLLGFEAQGYVESFLPLFLFCILFGLSMDYEVFMLSRVREEYLRSGDNTEAVGWGLEHTAGIITSAAAIMITVFGGFAAASLIPIKAMGFGLAAAVFLDATLIRCVLVPASMRLMGDWNWWLPGWLDRILPKISLEGADVVPPAPDTAPAKA